ncbi:MAG: hypothetical protein IT557_16460 [Alphaproteobacteria bacterium]|nr:hypothetical protein [Alphaproteobacteria bacterium]
MKRRQLLVLFGGVLGLGIGRGAAADPWKDESGRGREGRGGDRGPRPGRYPGEGPGIPRGHMPPPGEMRIWYPDRPAGHQPPPFRP